MTDLLTASRPAYAHKPRTVWPPSLFIIHATRGHVSNAQQDEATVNFFGGVADYGGWCPTADCLVAADDDRAWVFERSLEALRSWRSSWSAGYGSIGPSQEWGADELGIGIEIGESDAREGYTDATVRRVAWLCAQIQQRLGFSLPEEHIGAWDQLRAKGIPRGYIGHEDLANGKKGGKTDPGSEWPWDTFLRYVAEEKHVAQSPGIETLNADAFSEHVWRALAIARIGHNPGFTSNVEISPLDEEDGEPVYKVKVIHPLERA